MACDECDECDDVVVDVMLESVSACFVWVSDAPDTVIL